MQWVMAAILICGATLFTSCMNEDNPVDPATNLSEMIIGKWITADIGGQAAPTNVKMVTTFISTTKAIASSSKVDFTEKDSKWNVYREDDVVIAGSIMPMEHTCIMLRTATTGCHTRALPLASTSWTAHCSAHDGLTWDRKTASGGKSPSTATR